MHNCNNDLVIITNNSNNNNKAVHHLDHDAASYEICGYILDDGAFIPGRSRHNRFWAAKTGVGLLLGAEISVFSTPMPKVILLAIQPPVLLLLAESLCFWSSFDKSLKLATDLYLTLVLKINVWIFTSPSFKSFLFTGNIQFVLFEKHKCGTYQFTNIRSRVLL